MADDPSGLESAEWVDIGQSQLLPAILPRGRYLQWQATLSSRHGSTSPLVRSVGFGFGM